MIKADVLGGNQVIFVDAGITVDGKREPSKVGAVDNRGNFNLVTANIEMINEADVIVMHTGASDSWIVKTQAPLIWVIHGRPLACFRPELQGKSNSYSLYQNISNWKRTKKMIYFWEEFKPHWDIFIPEEKQAIIKFPVIDETRFNRTGNKHTLKNPGKYNILICDSSREDIDLYELVIGCIEAVKQFPRLKIHFYGFDMPIPNCWNIVLNKLKELGGLGDLVGRVQNMELVYKAVDCLISPNRIITRTIGEALSCGIPVINQDNDKLITDYTCDISNAEDVVKAIGMFISDFDNKKINKDEIIKRSSVFNMHNYSNAMNKIYNEVLEFKGGVLK
jgi:glycosyltransferase involved in cell wall biosynthesis